MKKIFLALAAVAALASCVKENTLVPEQTADNLVTITAVSADTKTTLGNDGTSVVWQKDDAIKVVFKSPSKQYVTEFTTDIDGTATTAAFSGLLDAEVTTDACGDAGYAVYPSTVNVESDGKILFTVSETQNGLIEKGENLAYAEVSLNEIRNTHTTEATFANVLSLLKITVPQGVKKITVTSTDEDEDGVATPIAGNAPYFYTDGTLVINEEKWYDSDRVYSVVLQNQDNSDLDHTKSHYVHVFPGECEGLTITVDGTDCSYSKKVGAFTFVASKYHTLNIANIFNLASDTYAASPFGGIVEIPVITTVDEYEVTIPAEATWLTKTPSAKGAFHKDIVSFTAAANTTGAERAATVKINGVEVVISQKGYVLELLGNYIEKFSRGYGQPVESNSFVIKESDNPSKGVYLVDGILGGNKVYADYADGKLTCYDGSKSRILTVSNDFSTMTGNGFYIGTVSAYGEYSALKALGAPTLTSEEEALVGLYNESWTYDGASVETTNGMTISASDEAAYGRLKVTFLSNGGSLTCYANLDGNSLNVISAGVKHATYGEAYTDITMTISDKTLSFATLQMLKDWNMTDVTNYTATKIETSGGAITAEDLIGTYTQKFSAGGSSWPESIMEIQESDNPSMGELKIVDMYKYESSGFLYSLTCYANLEDDGQTLTVLCDGVKFGSQSLDGSFTENLQMTVSRVEGVITISFNGSTTLDNWAPIGVLTATKN